MNSLSTNHPVVAIARGPAVYPIEAPYNPDTRWPEYSAKLPVGTEANPVYATVREALRLLGLDAVHYGTPAWNPLAEIIQPGQTVVIKPNFVLSDHYRGGNPFSVVTHPAVLRAVVDYVWLATGGGGRIIIADTPQLDCDFEQLMERSRLRDVSELYRRVFGADIPIRDLRNSWFRYEGENYFASQANRRALPGDPDGSTQVDLGRRSAFHAVGTRAYYGADFNREETQSHHSGGRHDYMVSNTILGADVLISVPKLKVHKKVGVTLNAKGLVGTVTNKNYLIHYTLGGTETGGDQYPSNVLSASERTLMKLQRFLYDRLLARKDKLGNRMFLAIYNPFRRLARPLIRKSTDKINLYDGGNWHGNDSAWRMVADLMTIARFADREGVIRTTPQRRQFSFVDGIIGGEGNGPLFPDARPEGVILAGESYLAVDAAAARLMGFDPRRIPWMSELMRSSDLDFQLRHLPDIDIRSEVPGWSDLFQSRDPALDFKPHPGWMDHIEWRGPGG